MKLTVLCLLVGLCALSLADHPQKQVKITDKIFLGKQKDILRLFKYVNQPSYYKDHVEIYKTYHLHEHFDDYTKPEEVKKYYKDYLYNQLPKGEIFSVFYEPHLKEAIRLFNIFYYAKDYETFYKIAVAARFYANEGLYLYALSVAIVHRPDTYGIVLPPIYEVYPYYFFSSEVIQKAYKYKQVYYGHQQEHGTYKGYTIDANYSGYYLNLHPEQSLSYFTEDVGINALYYYFNIYYPYWLSSEQYDYSHDRRGENYYFIHQSILAKYYLERLSNGFGEIPFFSWEVPFETGYYPSLQYPNGLQFPIRPNHAHLYEYFYNYGQKYGNNKYAYSYTLVQDYERRIRDAIDKGFVFTDDGEKVDLYGEGGFNVLGNLIEGNRDSPDYHYYGPLHVYARHLLGYSYQPLNKYQVAPSALEHFETSLRDPAFYQFYKRIILYFQKYKSRLPIYTKKDLIFEGVEVKNVEFDRLITYFDYFYSDISNALYVTPQEFESDKVQVRVRQQRLNHKPFNYKVYVDSDQEHEAVVTVYIGPKYDEYGRYFNISQNHFNFAFFDQFKYQLKSGENVITRHSHEIHRFKKDQTSYKDLYQQVLGALNGTGEFHIYSHEAWYGYPQRFLLPKGTHDGYEYQFYVIVSPYVPPKHKKVGDASKHYFPVVGSGNKYIDGYPLGYPFDRPISCDQLYYEIPNSYFYSAKIYHRHLDDINASTADQ